ncbi:MAG: aldose 1-epimerase family protein [Oscillospiraceae bacterium]|nr:aldose 1-epimerase family protein [Oscillospiraceae bacterium]
MELQKIGNSKLQVVISPRAAEMQSIQDNSGTEYLWQGDPKYWNRRAYNIFPYIARLTEGSYLYKGKRYNMSIHGFLPETQMDVEHISENMVCYILKSSDATLKDYPFPFELRISYTLQDNMIQVTYDVLNCGDERMFFGIGGHPGFCVPIEDGLSFDDYILEFAEKCSPVRIGFSENVFLNGHDTEYALEDGRRIPLQHDLFDDDAIILKDVCRKITLKSNKGTKSVTVSYPDMDYLGIWHRPKSDAPYVCIEPWTSLCSREGIVEDIEKQPDLVSLEPKKRYINTWTIEIV